MQGAPYADDMSVISEPLENNGLMAGSQRRGKLFFVGASCVNLVANSGVVVSPSQGSPPPYQFGVFEFDPRAGELRKQGMKLKLQGQPLDILTMLLERPGEVVTREDLQKRLWASDTIVEFDHSLNAAIKRLRDALDDSAETPRYVETLARRGYRFIAPVDSPAMPQAASAKAALRGPLWRYKVWSAFAAIAALAAFGLFKYSIRKKPAEPLQTMQFTRLTTSGKAFCAAISPDGRYVAYVTGDLEAQSLRVLQVPTRSDIGIAPTEGLYFGGPTFSKDGNYIWYTRFEKPGLANVYVVPVLGGPERKILADADGPPALSPDGNRLAVVHADSRRDECALIVANQDGSGVRKLSTHRHHDCYSLAGAAWSPDSKTIAIGAGISGVAGHMMNVVTIEAEGGAERSIGSERWFDVEQVAWLADGSGLIMNAQQSSSLPLQLWQLSYPGGRARRITNDLNGYPSGVVGVTSDSSTLIAVPMDMLSNLWIAPQGEVSRARQISFGTARDGLAGLDWTADGRIVYGSLATPSPELRVMNADGSHSQPLMSGTMPGLYASACPDGRYIVFSSYPSYRTGSFDIWRADPDGANPKQLTRGTDNLQPSCSPDGKWVVFVGGPRLWKVSIDGGAPTRLTDYDARSAAISPDGKWVAAVNVEGDRWNIAVVPFEGGQPWKTIYYTAANAGFNALRWTPDGQALVYIDTRKSVSNLWAQPLTGGPPKQLTDFKSELIFDFAWSRDWKQLALARGTVTSDVVLIRNFR
jgi:Tol biopolymer transport system component/DNA-binding winged helix-turn-helix (wHTH) protein